MYEKQEIKNVYKYTSIFLFIDGILYLFVDRFPINVFFALLYIGLSSLTLNDYIHFESIESFTTYNLETKYFTLGAVILLAIVLVLILFIN